MPEDLGKENLIIVALEHGGSHKKSGHATIVCDPNGKKLWPYRIYHCEWKPLDVYQQHALFCGPSLVTVNARDRSGKIRIFGHTVRIDGWKAVLDRELIWEGDVSPIERACEVCGMLENKLTAKHRLPGGGACAALVKAVNASIPQEIERFGPAILAALTEVSCYHCDHTHYSL